MRLAASIARALALVALTLVILACSAWLSSRLIGATEHQTSLGTVSFEVQPSVDGDLTAYVPITDWGFSVDPIWAPLSLNTELRALNRETLLELAAGDSDALEATRDELQREAGGVILTWLGLTVLISVVMGSAVALLARSPSVRSLASHSSWVESARERAGRPHYLPAASVALSLAATGAVLLWINLAFDERAFDQPSYFARGAELPQLLDALSHTQKNYASSLDDVLQTSGQFLSSSSEISAGPTQTEGQPRSVILASDLHGNALAAKALEKFTDGAPVFLAGDFGQSGSAEERDLLAEPVSGLSDQVLAVSGNHDSAVMMEGLSQAGVEVLDGESARVDGMRVAGFADPLKWEGDDPEDPTRIYSFSELRDSEAAESAAREELIEWWDSLLVKPDVALIHQNGLAQELARQLSERISQTSAADVLGPNQTLTILTGHDHRQHIDRYVRGQLVVVDAGTAGASGPYGVGRESIGLARLGFNPSSQLETVDLLRVEPVSGTGQADRVVVDRLCPDKPASELCVFEPPTAELGE